MLKIREKVALQALGRKEWVNEPIAKQRQKREDRREETARSCSDLLWHAR